MSSRRALSIAIPLLTCALSATAVASGSRESERMSPPDPLEAQLADPAPDRGAIVVSMGDIGPLGSAGRGNLIITATGTASILHQGECVQMSLAAPELDRLRRELVADLAGLDAEIRTSSATDQPSTTVTVVDPDSGAAVETSVYGRERPPGFHRAVDRLAELVESIRAEGAVDEDAPILVTVMIDPAREPERTIDWPESAPDPTLGATRIAYVPAADAVARELRDALGPANADVGVRLPDGRKAVANWQASLPGR